MRHAPSDKDPGTAKSLIELRAPHQEPTSDGLEQRLLSRARGVGFDRGTRIVVGFSGGRDSLALAAALRRSRAALGLELILVHVDHRLRSSAADEAVRAEKLAAALDVECRVQTVPVAPASVHAHVGVEEAARRERYRLLFQVAHEEGAVAVATAHHLEDQAETVLLHLLRGSGVHGAAGMGERSPPPYAIAPGHRDISPEIASPWLWRPLLQEPRDVIDRYVRRLGLAWIEDPSNDDLSLRRNALRRQIMPVLAEQFPGAAAALARYARLAAADDEALEQLAAVALEGEVDPGGRLAAGALRAQPLAVQRRMVRRWLWLVTGSSAFTAERTDTVIDLARSKRGERVIEIGERWTVRLERGMLHLTRQGCEHEET